MTDTITLNNHHIVTRNSAQRDSFFQVTFGILNAKQENYFLPKACKAHGFKFKAATVDRVLTVCFSISVPAVPTTVV